MTELYFYFVIYHYNITYKGIFEVLQSPTLTYLTVNPTPNPPYPLPQNQS